jgi:hypothetical protein
MTKMKMVMFALVGLLVAVGSGWLWGSWGRWAAEENLRDAELRVQLAEARASLLSARVDLFEINFGKASADLERAKQAISTAAGLLEKAGRADEAASARQALAKAGEAQQMAGAVDQTASARVVDALTAIGRAGAAQGAR